jgi:AbrB family looped-hinge helix DNA binding protein
MAKAKTVLEEAVRIGAKNQITIPHRISKELRLKKGDHMLVRVVGKTVELVPARIIPAFTRQFFVIAPGDHYHGVAAPQNHLGVSRKGAVYQFAEAIPCICQTPCHPGSP